jgi:hypothetical protein
LRGTQIHPKKPAFLRPIKSFIFLKYMPRLHLLPSRISNFSRGEHSDPPHQLLTGCAIPKKKNVLTSGKINIQCRVLKKFLSRWRIFGSRWRLHVPEHREGEGGGAPPLGWWGVNSAKTYESYPNIYRCIQCLPWHCQSVLILWHFDCSLDFFNQQNVLWS